MNIENSPLGIEIHFPDYLILMGNKNSQFENIKRQYPHYDFVRVKQVHGDQIVESENCVFDFQVTADAHYSLAADLGLCISTADCIPAFIIHPTSGCVAGIHAGWRGVANRIVPKTIQKFQSLGYLSQELYLFIGPHIQKNSFEVDLDVKEQLVASIQSSSELNHSDFYEKMGNKFKVDLNSILKEQLLAEGIALENIQDLHIDTFTDLSFHSHRRDKEKAGRQLSFVLRKK